MAATSDARLVSGGQSTNPWDPRPPVSNPACARATTQSAGSPSMRCRTARSSGDGIPISGFRLQPYRSNEPGRRSGESGMPYPGLPPRGLSQGMAAGNTLNRMHGPRAGWLFVSDIQRHGRHIEIPYPPRGEAEAARDSSAAASRDQAPVRASSGAGKSTWIRFPSGSRRNTRTIPSASNGRIL